MEWKLVFLILVTLFLVYVAAVFIIKPARLVFRLFSCFLAGTVIILLANLVLGQMGMRIAINPATIFTVGVLNIPGAILLVVLNYFFV